MLKFDLIRPVASDSKPSTFEVKITTMQGDADNFHYLKLQNFKPSKVKDMAWLESIIRWGKRHGEVKGHNELEEHSIIQQIFFGGEMMDFEEINKDIAEGIIKEYKDWDLLPSYFLKLSPAEKNKESMRVHMKHVYYGYGWENPFSEYWHHDDYWADSYYKTEIKFIDEDLVEWEVKFDIS